MKLIAPDVRIADVESCDFGLIPGYDTATVLRSAMPEEWERYLASAVARRMIGELGVEHRHLTHLPGATADPDRLTAYDLARSAVERMYSRRGAELARLDALIFVSTSNPHPCNSQAAMLAGDFGFRTSCFDLKAGCSSGVLGLLQGALLIRAGCERVLVVMAENLSQLTPPDDLRMLLTVGDGAACVLLERSKGPGFLAMLHGTDAAFARAMVVAPTFPPAGPDPHYVYRVTDATAAGTFLRRQWRTLYRESLHAAGLVSDDLAHWFFHQTHRAQVDELLDDLAIPPGRTVRIVERHGNMGTPTFAVAMAQAFSSIEPGERYLLQAVGGGVSWCAIVAEHG